MELNVLRAESESKKRFGLSLNQDETKQFFSLLEIQPPPNLQNLSFLKDIVYGVLTKLPFQNVTMLARPKKPPTPAEIKSDMLEGKGGPCGTINPFLGAFLFRLGFEVYLVSGSMQQPHCHLALVVVLHEQYYYVDCGDGKPYFDPMKMDEIYEYQSPSWHWRTLPLKNGDLKIQFYSKENQWNDNCIIHREPQPFSFFEENIHSHYTTENYGPFLKSFRLIYYPAKKIEALRDMTHIFEENGTVIYRELTTFESFYQIIQKKFPFSSLPIERAVETLIQRKIKPFATQFQKN